MKYIRTKDGKILEKYTFTLNGKKYIGDPYSGLLCIEEDIIKQADSIEELCDEFVLLYEGAYIFICLYGNEYGFKFSEDNNLYKIDNTYEIYGAIWTDIGLIYVAKMNEKGELELI